MAKPKMHADYLSAVKKAKKEHPFSLLPAQIPESSGNYAYPLRKTTLATTVKLYQPILQAVQMYVQNENTSPDMPYMMIAVKTLGATNKLETTYYLETIDEDGDTLFVSVKGDHIRISKVAAADPTDTSPLVAFSQQTTRQLTAVSLALLPRILEIDEKNGGKLGDVISALGPELNDIPFWTDANDIPELVKEHLYFTDAAIPILDSIELDFGDSTSTAPEEVESGIFNRPIKLKGAVVCQDLGNNWTPRFIEGDGTKVQRMAAAMTIGMAKQMFSGYSAGRNWTAAEKALIPNLPEDMPLMPEVMQIAKRITRDGSNGSPARNGMWRSDTGYGKSTGIKQLACILDVPLLIMTCHPNMETQDFMSTFVPASDDVAVDPLLATPATSADTAEDRPPFFNDAMRYIATLDEGQRNALFDVKQFFNNLMIEDTEELAATIIGSKQDISAEELFQLYTEVRSAALREGPLRMRIKKLEADAKNVSATDASNKSNEPQFIHVESNFIKAMSLGYLCEVQEPSRIRDAGVLVGLNEFYAPGSALQLVSGKTVKRHPNAICIFTDNVGYAGCKSVDQSVIRRQDFIVDSDELTKEQLFERIKFNTHCNDMQLMELAYRYWFAVKEFCAQNSITDGSTSPVELECFVKELMYEGVDALELALNDCVISKSTSNRDDQRDIRTACLTAQAA